MKFPRRRSSKVLLTIALLVPIGWLAAGFIVGKIIASKLQSQLAEHLEGAVLEIGNVWYRVPLGVSISHARLTLPPGEDGKVHEALSLGKLRLDLAQIPLGGPVLIEKIDIDNPVVRITPRPPDESSTQPTTTTSPSTGPRGDKKLSDIFRLRKVVLRGGRIEFGSTDDPDSPPMIWKNIDVDTDLTPKDAARYAFKIAARNAELAELNVDGNIDIDELICKVDKLVMNVKVPVGAPPEELPAPIQSACRDYKVGGSMRIEAEANLPLLKITESQGTMRITLDDGQVMHHDASVRAFLRAGYSLIVAEDFLVRVGNDELTLTSARIPIRNLSRGLRINEVVARVNMRSPPERLPTEVGQIIHELEPTGVIDISGSFARWYATDRVVCNVQVSTDDLNIVVTDYKIPITKIRTDSVVSMQGVTISGIDGQCLGGLVHVDGQVGITGEKYVKGRASVHGLDLHQLAVAMKLPQKEQENLAGKASIDVKFDSSAASLDAVEGNGEFSITDGKLWEIPVMKEIIAHFQDMGGALTVGEAAGLFKIGKRQVTLKNAAVSAPVLGVQGNGTIGFDKDLNLDLNVMPLGNWKKQIQSTGVPIFSRVVGEVAGGVQSVFTFVQSELSGLKVTGKIPDQKLEWQPTPRLTKAGESVLKAIVQPGSGERLIDSVRKNEE